MVGCGAKSMMPLHANFPLKTDSRPSIATRLYHVALENRPLTLKLPLGRRAFTPCAPRSSGSRAIAESLFVSCSARGDVYRSVCRALPRHGENRGGRATTAIRAQKFQCHPRSPQHGVGATPQFRTRAGTHAPASRGPGTYGSQWRCRCECSHRATPSSRISTLSARSAFRIETQRE